jgi:hypothetical protein
LVFSGISKTRKSSGTQTDTPHDMRSLEISAPGFSPVNFETELAANLHLGKLAKHGYCKPCPNTIHLYWLYTLAAAAPRGRSINVPRHHPQY